MFDVRALATKPIKRQFDLEKGAVAVHRNKKLHTASFTVSSGGPIAQYVFGSIKLRKCELQVDEETKKLSGQSFAIEFPWRFLKHLYPAEAERSAQQPRSMVVYWRWVSKIAIHSQQFEDGAEHHRLELQYDAPIALL